MDTNLEAITDSHEIKQCLEEIARERPNKVIRKLVKGTKVGKGLGALTGQPALFYEIDDAEIYKRLGDDVKGIVPYSRIYKSLKYSDGDNSKLFNGAKIIPFSKAYDAGIGECLEKAILTHLCVQDNRDAFLINGEVIKDGEIPQGHAFNVVFKDGKPFLVDTHNPSKTELGNVIQPYIIPITGIKDGEFQLPEELRKERTYIIF